MLSEHKYKVSLVHQPCTGSQSLDDSLLPELGKPLHRGEREPKHRALKSTSQQRMHPELLLGEASRIMQIISQIKQQKSDTHLKSKLKQNIMRHSPTVKAQSMYHTPTGRTMEASTFYVKGKMHQTLRCFLHPWYR